VDLQHARQPEIWKPDGLPGRQKSVRDAVHHLTYLAESLEADAPALFSEYLAWLKALFAGLKFPTDVLPTTLECTRQPLGEALPAGEREAALAILEMGLRSLETAVEEPVSFLYATPPWPAWRAVTW
jgi:hypothetical protein